VKFELLTLAGTKFSGDVEGIHLKLSHGEAGIMAHHEPITAVALPGPLQVHLKNGKTEVFAAHGGILSVRSDAVRLLADEAEAADELIEHEIEAALAKAEQLKTAAQTKHELERAQHMIDRHHVRLHVARLRRRHRPGRQNQR
jgi:F-type H+-transporting ATPase subunit epsilon